MLCISLVVSTIAIPHLLHFPFSKLISSGVTVDTIRAWSVDPQVKGKSIFDQLEDMNAEDCVKKSIDLAA